MAIHPSKPCDPCWRNMATIQVDAKAGDLNDILDDISFDSRLDSTSAPAGKARFNLVVNASRGASRSAMTTFALLSALSAIAESGVLPGFEIVAGGHWLDLGQAAKGSPDAANVWDPIAI